MLSYAGFVSVAAYGSQIKVLVLGGSGVARSLWRSGRVIAMSALNSFTNFKNNRIYLLSFLIFG